MSEETYTVEKISGHKPETAEKVTEVEKFFVKWEGFVETENTWEPAKNLNKTTIKEYWQSVKKTSDAKISAEDVAKEITSEKKVTKAKKAIKQEKKVTAKNEPEEEIEEYVVEAITGVVPRNAKSDEEAKKYIIKWEGFGDDEKTTEPADQIRNTASECVADFWKAKNATEEEEENKEEESEEEVKLSSRGRKIKTAKPIIPEPSKKKTKVTPSKSQKRKSPSKNTKSSPASQLDDEEEKEVNGSFVNDLVTRVDAMETEKGKWKADRAFLKALCERDDMPANIVAEIEEYIITHLLE